MIYDEDARPFRGTIRCHECNALLEVIEGEEVEPCWDCIKAAKEAERMKHSPYKEALEEKAAKVAEAVNEIREEYKSNSRAMEREASPSADTSK